MREKRERITFVPNLPQVVTLKYPVGKIVSGRFSDQVMWGLEGDKVMFLSLHVAQQINSLKPETGDTIGICKVVQEGQTIAWDVWITPETEIARAHRSGELPPPDGDESEVAQQIRGTLENLREGLPAAAPRPQAVPAAVARRLDSHPGASADTPAPETATSKPSSPVHVSVPGNRNTTNPLIDEANALVDVYAAVLERALNTYQGRVKPDEIRSIVLSCYIQQGKGSRYAAA
jgi:hypothetical protein